MPAAHHSNYALNAMMGIISKLSMGMLHNVNNVLLAIAINVPMTMKRRLPRAKFVAMGMCLMKKAGNALIRPLFGIALVASISVKSIRNVLIVRKVVHNVPSIKTHKLKFAHYVKTSIIFLVVGIVN